MAGLGLLSAVLAAGVHVAVFSDGSANNDEVAYLLQAQALADGELFPDVPPEGRAAQPWFFVARDGEFVPKYLPLVPALLAVGLRLTGTVVPVLALLAALVPVLVAALARELGLDRRDQLLAAGLVALSPVVVVQSALPLSYVPFLVLVQVGWLLALRLAAGRAGPGSAALLGAAGSAAAGVRPYDAVLLLGPAVLWAAYRQRHRLGALLGPALLGGLPLTAAIAAYDLKATGSPWRLPFGLLQPQDALGFGVRRMFPEDDPHVFGLPQALHGLAVHFGVAPLTWYALGALLLPAAVVAWRRPEPGTRVLLACAAVMLAGYAVFWGPWNFSVVWRHGRSVFGPVYATALVVPVVLAGLPVLRAALARWPRRGRVLVVGAAALSLVQLVAAGAQAAQDDRRTERLLEVAASAPGPLLLDVGPPYLGHPVSRLQAARLAAHAPVPPAGASLPQLLQVPHAPYGGAFSWALTQTRRAAGPQVALEVDIVGRRTDVLVVERAGRAGACPLVGRAVVTLTRDGTTGCSAEPVPSAWPGAREYGCPDERCVVLALFREDGSGTLRRTTWRRLPVDTRRDGVAVLVDAELLRSQGAGWLRVTAAP